MPPRAARPDGFPLDLCPPPVKTRTNHGARQPFPSTSTPSPPTGARSTGCRRPRTQTAAVVKADAYGLGVARVARALAQAGARRFFVAMAEEGAALRQVLGPGPQICVLGGHMAGDTEMVQDLDLTPMLNSIDQVTRHLEALPGHPFGVQLDTGHEPARAGSRRMGGGGADPAGGRSGAADEPPRLRRRAGSSDECGATGRVPRDDRRHRRAAQPSRRRGGSCWGRTITST